MNGGGSIPLTKTLIEARADTAWWTTPAASTTPYTYLSHFC